MRRTALLLFAAALPAGLAACGGTTSAKASGTVPTTTAPARRPASAPPGTAGIIAAVTPASSSMQVQGPSIGEVTVSWTASTRFTQTKAETAGSVAVGDCVAVTGTPAGSAGVTARNVTITPAPATGTCTPAGRGNGGPGSGAPGGGGFRRSQPGGPATGNGSSTTRPVAPATPVTIAFGKVTSVSGSGFGVSGILRTGFRGAAGSTTTTRPSPVSIAVTTTGSTTYSETGPATASALAVGSCVSAIGKAGTTGAVTASSISIRPSVNGQCQGGFGPGGFFGGARGAAQGSGGA